VNRGRGVVEPMKSRGPTEQVRACFDIGFPSPNRPFGDDRAKHGHETVRGAHFIAASSPLRVPRASAPVRGFCKAPPF